jgi:cytochrome P450
VCCKANEFEQKDGLQWLIVEGDKLGDPKHLEPHTIGHRLMLLNFVSMHSTSLTMTNVFQDLLSSEDALTTIEDLRVECSRIFAECEGVWTKAAVDKLCRVDSAIRESMRMSSFSVLALPRRVSPSHRSPFQRSLTHYQVSAPEGIEIENNIRIPQGIPLATPMDAIHLDENFYPDPNRYYAFRFCTRSQIHGTKTAAKYEKLAGEAESVSPKQQSSATLDDAFLSFGLGKHACPGRFFAVHEMKMMLAYIVMNYEIETFDERPPQKRVMWIQLPREDTKIKIRRRV